MSGILEGRRLRALVGGIALSALLALSACSGGGGGDDGGGTATTDGGASGGSTAGGASSGSTSGGATAGSGSSGSGSSGSGSSGSSSGDTALDCLQVAVLQRVGTTSMATYDWSLASDSTVIGTVSATQVVTTRSDGPSTYNGEAVYASHITVLTVMAGAPATTSVYDSYQRLSGTSLFDVGEVERGSDGTMTSRQVYEPGMEMRYGLAAGASFTTDVTETTTSDTGTVSQTRQTMTETFLGHEAVTVPAGTFTGTCKFRVQQSHADGTMNDVTVWMHPASMLLLKLVASSRLGNDSFTETQVLRSATIDGVALAP